jgi:hypothetical protein
MTEQRLQHIVLTELVRARPGSACGCAACRRRRARHPAGDRNGSDGDARGTRPRWSPPVSLREILRARARAAGGEEVPPRLRPFLAPGRPRLFRVARTGIDLGRPLVVLATWRRPVVDRLQAHRRRPGRPDPRLHAALRHLGPHQIMVQYGPALGRGLSRCQLRGRLARTEQHERPLVTRFGAGARRAAP